MQIHLQQCAEPAGKHKLQSRHPGSMAESEWAAEDLNSGKEQATSKENSVVFESWQI